MWDRCLHLKRCAASSVTTGRRCKVDYDHYQNCSNHRLLTLHGLRGVDLHQIFIVDCLLWRIGRNEVTASSESWTAFRHRYAWNRENNVAHFSPFAVIRYLVHLHPHNSPRLHFISPCTNLSWMQPEQVFFVRGWIKSLIFQPVLKGDAMLLLPPAELAHYRLI